MSDPQSAPAPAQAPQRAAWGAVISMTLGVFGLVTAEFLPASLLTPMANDLNISEGMAGQAVSTTAALALVTSLLITAATRKIDRRYVLIGFSVLLLASNALVALAPSLSALLFGRILLGIAIGGFWTMSAATIMRLVPEETVPRALSILFSGVSAATVFAAPLGSYLGETLGWREVFWLASILGLLALVSQFLTLPKMPPRGHANLRTLIEVMTRPRMKFGLMSIVVVITGHFALFTYVRPFLENVTGVAAAGVSGILLGFGVANFIGTYLGGALISRSLRLTLAVMPLLIGLAGLGMVSVQGATLATTALVAVWGLAFGAVPVAWSTWITRTVPDEAESGGGLLVAAFQLAITLGAVIGGVMFDANGAIGVFGIGGLIPVIGALMIAFGVRSNPVATERA